MPPFHVNFFLQKPGSRTAKIGRRSSRRFGATLLFAGNLEGKTQTMPLAIYVGFEQGLGIALVLSVVLLAVSLGLLAVLRRLEVQGQH